MPMLAGLFAGLMFGLGLMISGLGNPAKVLNFLDITGNWDPSLILVMISAIITTAIGYRLVFLRDKPVFNTQYFIPTRKDIDSRLVVGAMVFGLGWGIGGFCPGPAWVGLTMGNPKTQAFIVAMLVGMFIAKNLSAKLSATTNAANLTSAKA